MKPLPDGIEREKQDDGTYVWYTTNTPDGARIEIDPDQAWFWTKEWQAAEKEADEDIREGRVYTFDNAEDFLKALKP